LIPGTSFLGIDKRTSSDGIKARKRRERQQELDDINDDDVKRDLAETEHIAKLYRTNAITIIEP
jgi:hypothetical protein